MFGLVRGGWFRGAEGLGQSSPDLTRTSGARPGRLVRLTKENKIKFGAPSQAIYPRHQFYTEAVNAQLDVLTQKTTEVSGARARSQSPDD